MIAAAGGETRPGVAAALEIVQNTLAAAERALLAGQHVDLAQLEAQILVLCEESTRVEASARRTASETLGQLLDRLSVLEAAVAASAPR
jgi:hypothetical protein